MAATKKKAPVKKKAAVKKKAVAVKKKAVTAPKKKTTPTASPKAAPKKTAAAKKPASSAPKEKGNAVMSDDLNFSGFTPYEMKKGEDYMNPRQVEHLRNLLLSWKRELMAKVDETVHHMQDEAANFPDPNDRASQESDFTMELRTRDRERKLIKKIEQSLTALDGDDFGYCKSCGIEIGIRRLEARPTATECIDCKTLNEIKEKQYGK
jgi:DnaK suppressor protein